MTFENMMTAMNIPLVSIVVATKNESPNIGRCLESITHQTYHKVEILVVDNFSSDDTQQIARRFTRKIFSKGQERSSQRNFATHKANGAFLLFLDADMAIPPNCITECLKKMAQKQTVAVTIPEEVPPLNFFARIKNLEKQLYQNTMLEAARFFKKSVFLEVGGFDENLVAGEDWDLSQRVAQHGKIALTSTPLMHFETSFIRELKHKWYYANLIKNYVNKHPIDFKNLQRKRLFIFWEKRSLLIKQPLLTIALLSLKVFEYLIYLIRRAMYAK